MTLKLKTADFRALTRSRSLSGATRLAHRMFDAARPLLRSLADGQAYRLIGVGISHLVAHGPDEDADLDPRLASRTRAELAMDRLKAKFGETAIGTGRTLGPRDDAADD